MFESQYNEEMAAEARRLEAHNRATAAGHPEWVNACAVCSCELATIDIDTCGHCSQRGVTVDSGSCSGSHTSGAVPGPNECKSGSTAEDLKRQLQLLPHPEGGWYRESYRSAVNIAAAALPESFDGVRCVSTAIYFLLERGDISILHRIKSDELWHFYAGASLTVHVIDPAGEYRKLELGSDIAAGAQFQAVVPAGCWFGAEMSAWGEFALVGCTVAPGFDFADFEMGERGELMRRYPQHAVIISRLTKAAATTELALS
jgi:predicted cupin superfamily sugar epimerase